MTTVTTTRTFVNIIPSQQIITNQKTKLPTNISCMVTLNWISTVNEIKCSLLCEAVSVQDLPRNKKRKLKTSHSE
jgi:hypothetical protein